jgi:hypothetical protein
MRRMFLILVVVGAALVAYAGAPGTDLGGVSHSGAAYLPPESNGFLDFIYMTDEYSAGLLQNGIATSPSYGWVSTDDFVLEDDVTIDQITYWVINYQEASGYYHRFWNDTGGSGPGSELDNGSATFELISTGEYSWGYLLYQADIDLDPDYDIDAGHYWGASYFSSGFWYMLVRTNAYDEQCYFDQSGGGSGPWYTSSYMWGSAYDFFQIIDGVTDGGDEDPPYVCDMDPDDGEMYVLIDSDIIFHCKDDLHPVDLDTIDFTARDTTLGHSRAIGLGSPNRYIAGDLYLDDTDPLDVVCTFDPDDDFYECDLITCTVAAGLADSKGNATVDDFVWSFDTYTSVEETTWGAVKAEFSAESGERKNAHGLG